MNSRYVISEKIEQQFWVTFGYINHDEVYCDECADMHKAITDKEISS